MIFPIKKYLNKSEKSTTLELNISPEYKKVVDDCINNKIDTNIKNCDVNHAKYLLYRLIKRTKKNNGKIKIFSGNMNEAVYGDSEIQEALKEALRMGIEITIILEKKLGLKEKAIVKLLSNNSINNLKIYKLNDDVIHKFKTEGISFDHFLVSDSIAFRIEKPHDENAFKKNQINADVNFNNKEFANKICELFDYYLSPSSTNISI